MKTIEFPAGEAYRVMVGPWSDDRVGLEVDGTGRGSCVMSEADARTLRDWLTAWLEERVAARPVQRAYWTSEIDGSHRYDCFCPGCGVQMKGRAAGVDEGTDLEWCGVCREGR